MVTFTFTGVKSKFYKWVKCVEGRTSLSNDLYFGWPSNVKRGEVKKPIRVSDKTKNYYFFIIISGPAVQCGVWHPRSRGFSITHNDAPQSVGLL
jgi:hypothetical protein